jgi:hypothetical protein
MTGWPPDGYETRFERPTESALEWERRSFAEGTPRSIRWLVPGVIPMRTSTLTAGQGGLGKSTWLMAVAAQLTRGALNGGTPGSVIVFSYEDTLEEILTPAPRLQAPTWGACSRWSCPPSSAAPCSSPAT